MNPEDRFEELKGALAAANMQIANMQATSMNNVNRIIFLENEIVERDKTIVMLQEVLHE